MTNPLQEHMMSNLRGHDIGEVIDKLWANAALPRVTGLSQAKPEEVSALTGFDPISQEGASDE